MLLGTQSRSLLQEYLLGPAMEIRVHDRDRIINTSSSGPALFGDDGEDEKINNVGYISGNSRKYSRETLEKFWRNIRQM